MLIEVANLWVHGLRSIDLNPSYGLAYHSRAMAFVSKGDYVRAIADATKASELECEPACNFAPVFGVIGLQF